MDILGQYEKQHPETPSQPLEPALSQDFQQESALTRMMIRFSGGRIRDARQANIVWGLFTILAFIIILSVLYQSAGTTINTKKNFVPAEIPLPSK